MARVSLITQLELDRLLKRPGLHAVGGGLYISVGASPSNACSWITRYTIRGRARSMGLGPYPEINLTEARAKAAEGRRVKAHGHDPLEIRRAADDASRVARAKRFTFKEAAEAYIRDHSAGWKRGGGSLEQWEFSFAAYVYPIIGFVPVGSIDTGLVMKVLKGDVRDRDGHALGPLWTTRPETASRIRRRLAIVLDWATVNGYRERSPNPAAWKGHLDNNLPSRNKIARAEAYAALAVADVPAFMAELRRQRTASAAALELTILTAARTSEILGATWGELDMGKAIWTIPAARMKAGRPHTVPLSDRAVTILRDLPKEHPDDFVFAGRKPGRGLNQTAMVKFLGRMGYPELTVHGMRSTFRDWAAENGVPRDLAEVCLAHTVGDATERSYLRTDVLERRRPVMEAWANYCADVADDVSDLPKASAA